MTTTESIAGHITRLRPGRPGICDWAQREVDRLRTRMTEAEAMPEGPWRELHLRAVAHQMCALEGELANLGTPVIISRGAA